MNTRKRVNKMFGLTLITTKKYENLCFENESLKSNNKSLKNRCDELEKKLKEDGDRICGDYCIRCKYSIQKPISVPPYILYSCELNYKCPDFERQ